MHIISPRYLLKVPNMKKIHLAIKEEYTRMERLTEGWTWPVPIFLDSAIAERGIIIASNNLWNRK